MSHPTFSIITPSNNLDWLTKAAKSVFGQIEQDWEWIVLINGPIVENPDQVKTLLGGDQRLRVIKFGSTGNIGSLKKCACMCANGTYIVEFDHDDELSVDCLVELRTAFERPRKPVFVFSDCVSVNSQGLPYVFGSSYGWKYTPATFNGPGGVEQCQVPVCPELLPQNIANVYHAPNHVRSWRRDIYNRAGGHSESLEVCDDLDLMCRLYLHGKFEYVHKALYKYRVHTDNTWRKNQDKIDKLNLEIYDRYVEHLALVYSRGNSLGAYDLGGGINSPAGWTSVDKHSANIIADLSIKWPFDNNSVGALRSQDFIEHIKDHIHVMNEAYRVLTHGGLFLIDVPSTDGRGAFQDPSHVSFWNSNSAWYYTKLETQKYIKHLGVNCRFQQVRLLDHFPSEWHRTHNILYTKMHLAAIKDGPRLHGLIEI